MKNRWSDVTEPVFAAFAAALETQIGRLDSDNPSLVVAYSGGLDSHVLLLAAKRWCDSHASASLRAVYVDHGLQECSSDWAAHCARECNALAVAFQAVTATVVKNTGDSPEQAARNARYAVLTDELDTGEILLTAHHADDQAETLLLQLLRGAGVNGLAAMPDCKPFAGGWLMRPLLSVSREQLQTAAQALELSWVEDSTNLDTRFDRNYLRHEILPRLRSRWPAMATSFSRSASHCAEAAAVLRDIAAKDAESDSNVMAIETLLSLSESRRRNVLRSWIEYHGFTMPSAIKLQHIESDLVMASADSSGQVLFGEAQLRRHRGNLYIGTSDDFKEVLPFVYQWVDCSQPLLIEETGQRLTAADLPDYWAASGQTLVVRSRQGGESICLSGHKHTHSVKGLLQQQGQPLWQRSRLPFVWCNDQLIGIVGVGFINPPA